MSTIAQEPRPQRQYHHGRSPATWTGSVLALVGFIVAGIGFVVGINWVVIGIGLGLVALGVIAGWAISIAGFGG